MQFEPNPRALILGVVGLILKDILESRKSHIIEIPPLDRTWVSIGYIDFVPSKTIFEVRNAVTQVYPAKNPNYVYEPQWQLDFGEDVLWSKEGVSVNDIQKRFTNSAGVAVGQAGLRLEDRNPAHEVLMISGPHADECISTLAISVCAKGIISKDEAKRLIRQHCTVPVIRDFALAHAVLQ